MLVCDCWFWRQHQEGVTEKELAQITERAKKLRVTLVSDGGVVKIYRVEGGEAIHYATSYPDGDKGNMWMSGSANCKHLIAVRSFIGEKDEQARNLQEIMRVEGGGEDESQDVPCGVSAVG